MEPENQIAAVAARWGNLTLEDLRQDALRELSGIRYEAVRERDGPRILLVVCITLPRDMAMFSKLLGVDPMRDIQSDWTAILLADLIAQKMPPSGSGVLVVSHFAAAKSVDALALILAGPDSITKFSELTGMLLD